MNFETFLEIINPEILLLVFCGTLLGVILGAIPGLSGTVGIALLLPLTFSMEPQAALLMLGGIFMGGMYGGSITAILINVPGDLPATMTAIEGYPMAKAGRAKEALYYSIFSSMFGGLFGVLALIFFTPQLAKIALRFGPPEMFLTALCGLAVVAALTGKNKFKAFFAVAFGMLISMVGMDKMSMAQRFTFGNIEAMGGVSVIPVCIGLFCFAEMFHNIGDKVASKVYYKPQSITRRNVIGSILKKWILLLKSSCIGTLIGILPGIGSSMAIFLAYGEAKRTSKHPEEYGKGAVEGIIAAESANNSLVGGTMVPMLALGIPGSPTAAMIGSALTIHGIMCGPELFTKSPEIAHIFMYGMLFSVLAMTIIGAFGIKYFSLVLKAKVEYIIPVVLVFALFGTYSLNHSVFEVIIAVALGIIGAIFKRFEIPVAPVVIGAVLSSLIELNIRRSITIASAKSMSLLQYMYTRPMCIILTVVVITLFILFFSMGKGRKKKIKKSIEDAAD